MSCEHPNCSQSIHSICTNHCHWSLCQEHLNEHKNSLLIEFEEVLEDLIKPTNELSKSIEIMKKISNENQAKKLEILQRSYQNEIDQFDQKLIELNKYQNQFNQISEHLNEIKTNKKLLNQNDFQQIEILSKQINQYNFHPKIITPLPELNQCPLTSLNIFGLSSSHNVKLCPPNRKRRQLFEHFRNYHHLLPQYANQLIEAVQIQSDPMERIIFPPNTRVTASDEKHQCAFYDTNQVEGIRSRRCSSMVTNKYLPTHLKTVHRLRSIQIKRILQSN